jgi:hypothetical protein
MPTRKKRPAPKALPRQNDWRALALAGTTFLPPTLVNRRFVNTKRGTDWLGADSFVVLGDVGPYVVPTYENASGVAFVTQPRVALDVEIQAGEHSLFFVERHEFADLITRYALVPLT